MEIEERILQMKLRFAARQPQHHFPRERSHNEVEPKRDWAKIGPSPRRSRPQAFDAADMPADNGVGSLEFAARRGSAMGFHQLFCIHGHLLNSECEKCRRKEQRRKI